MTLPPRHWPAWPLYLTAFVEGLIVIVVEIAGARALAPFYGTSLQVWTAMITMTLFFLATGYGVGGIIARNVRPQAAATLFGVAGAWLIAYPFLRTPILDITRPMGVGLGALAGSSILFGLPLMMLGAISPVLVAIIDARRPGAGSAAGRLFFTNTLGGLVGGWITAFLVIPHTTLRHSLVTTGLILLTLALLWAAFRRARLTASLIVGVFLAGLGVRLFHQPQREFMTEYGEPVKLLYSQQSAIGLLQVIDLPASRMQLTNGVIQGEMNLATRRSSRGYVDYLNAVSYMHHPQAKSALILGLGPGLLARELAMRGVEVTAVEIEPRVVDLARKYFDLPDTIRVAIEDGRTFLRRDDAKYDLIFVDTYAGESTAWYLLTLEAMRDVERRLNPGGRLLINNVSWSNRRSEGIERIEATAQAVFGEVTAYPDAAATDDPDDVSNTTLVAGKSLSPIAQLPPTLSHVPELATKLRELARPAPPNLPRELITTDDRSDLDHVESNLRIRWRVMIWDWMKSSLLWD